MKNIVVTVDIRNKWTRIAAERVASFGRLEEEAGALTFTFPHKSVEDVLAKLGQGTAADEWREAIRGTVYGEEPDTWLQEKSKVKVVETTETAQEIREVPETRKEEKMRKSKTKTGRQREAKRGETKPEISAQTSPDAGSDTNPDTNPDTRGGLEASVPELTDSQADAISQIKSGVSLLRTCGWHEEHLSILLSAVASSVNIDCAMTARLIARLTDFCYANNCTLTYYRGSRFSAPSLQIAAIGKNKFRRIPLVGDSILNRVSEAEAFMVRS